MTTSRTGDDLPGADLVEAGIADLSAGRETIEALLVASAAECFTAEPDRLQASVEALLDQPR